MARQQLELTQLDSPGVSLYGESLNSRAFPLAVSTSAPVWKLILRHPGTIGQLNPEKQGQKVEHAAMERNRTLKLLNIQPGDNHIPNIGRRVHHRPQQYGPRELTTHQAHTSKDRQQTPAPDTPCTTTTPNLTGDIRHLNSPRHLDPTHLQRHRVQQNGGRWSMALTNLGTERHGEVAPPPLALARRSVSQVGLSLACVTDTTHTHTPLLLCVRLWTTGIAGKGVSLRCLSGKVSLGMRETR